mgnify:CR=1 FL=1
MFFIKLKKEYPKLYWFILAFCFLQIAFTCIKLEATPFLLFGMYSQKHQPADTVVVYQHITDGIAMPYNKLNHWQNDILLTTAGNYYSIIQNKGVDVVDTRIQEKYPAIYNTSIFQAMKQYIINDSAAVKAYPDWYISQLKNYLKIPVQHYQLQRHTYFINPSNQLPQLTTVETIIEY